jgi:multidrug resistance efflux pump
VTNGETTGPSPSLARASSRPPRAQPWSKQRKILTLSGLGVLSLLAVLVIVLWSTGALFGRPPFNGPTWKVQKQKLKIAIVERGSLESANNGDIVCYVKARTQGSTVASTIKWLVEAGYEAKGPEWKKGSDWRKDVLSNFIATTIGLGSAPPGNALLIVPPTVAFGKSKTENGEVVMELDSSGLIDQLQTQGIEVDKARSTLVQADEDYHIQELDNATDIEKAENTLKLAKIDLEKYLKGDYPQAEKDIKGRLVTTKSDVDDWETRAAWSARMVKKGLMSKVQADTDASRAEGARIAMGKVEEELRVLEYTRRRTVQDLNAKLAEAKRGLEKAESQARSKLEQKRAARQSARSVWEQQVTRKRDLEIEIFKCTLRAPQEGMVVYYVPEQVRGGGGSQQSIVAQGEPVREGQKMLQIPDLSQMLVNVRVHEALVAHLHNEDPDDRSTGQKALIRVDAYPNRILEGHVKRVDTVASQQDWFSADVKLYKTLVSIDDTMDGLKPGMSAEVTIIAKATTDPVLVLPIQSVVGTISMGSTRKCFVLGADGQPEMRDIVIGLSNEQLVEVKPWDESTRTGLKEGERVVQNPAPLLQGSEMRPGRIRKSSESDDADHGGGGGKKNGKKKGDGNGKGFGGPKGPPTPGAGPGAGPGPKTAKGFGGGAPSQEQMQAFVNMMRSKTPAERRDFLKNLPEDRRAGVRQFLRSQNLEVAE